MPAFTWPAKSSSRLHSPFYWHSCSRPWSSSCGASVSGGCHPCCWPFFSRSRWCSASRLDRHASRGHGRTSAALRDDHPIQGRSRPQGDLRKSIRPSSHAGRGSSSRRKPTRAKPASPNSEAAPAKAVPEQKPLPVEVHQPEPSPLELAERILTPVVSPLATLAATFIVAIFILLQREDLRDRLISLFGSGDLHRTTLAMDDAAERLSNYLLMLLGVNTGFGVIIGIGLYFIGVPSPILWAVLSALLRFIPYIGAPLSAIPPLALAAAVDPGLGHAAVDGRALRHRRNHDQPGRRAAPLWPQHRIVAHLGPGLGDVLDMAMGSARPHPLDAAHLVSSRARTPCRPPAIPRHRLGRSPRAHARREFLSAHDRRRSRRGARPGRAPAQGMPALRLLRRGGAEGMQLAAHDVERGVIGPAEARSDQGGLERARSRARQLRGRQAAGRGEGAGQGRSRRRTRRSRPPAEDIPVLEREELPAAWQGEAPILCVYGRGPFDDTASAMLAQLLGKHGLGARTVSHAAISRSAARASPPRAWR